MPYVVYAPTQAKFATSSLTIFTDAFMVQIVDFRS